MRKQCFAGLKNAFLFFLVSLRLLCRQRCRGFSVTHSLHNTPEWFVTCSRVLSVNLRWENFKNKQYSKNLCCSLHFCMILSSEPPLCYSIRYLLRPLWQKRSFHLYRFISSSFMRGQWTMLRLRFPSHFKHCSQHVFVFERTPVIQVRALSLALGLWQKEMQRNKQKQLRNNLLCFVAAHSNSCDKI